MYLILDEIVSKKQEYLWKNDLSKYIKIESRSYQENSFKKIFLKDNFIIIGEFKKASPSKGIILENFQIEEILKEYEKLPITAYSVLTEEDYFLGNNEYLKYVSKNSKRPTLRKDFIINEYQIYEAKYLGAEAILLIVAILGEKLKHFYEVAINTGLVPLVEIHNKEELNKALEVGVEIIGINNRNLRNFKVDLNTTENLLQDIPKGKIVISESGISTIEDIKYIKSLGVKGVLIGETLIRNLENQEFKRNLKRLLE